MTEEQRKRAYAEMERRMAQSAPEVETPVKSAPDPSAMQERMERVLSPQEKESPAPVPEIPAPVIKSTPAIEQQRPVSEPPKPHVLSSTVESPVAQPVIEQQVQYSAPIQLNPPAVKSALPIETKAPYLQPMPKKRVSVVAWVIGVIVLIGVVEVIWLLVS